MRDERIENQKKAKEKHAFQAETKELLNIMINSLYTHREIFLREGSKSETVIETKTLNSMIPIWEKNKKDITKDEYFQFYKHHFHDWNEFVDVIHIKAEGRIQYTALLFIPSKASSDLYDKEYSKGINLYANHVFIMKDCQDLLPDHLRFVRGLVDSPDFSLKKLKSISRGDLDLDSIVKDKKENKTKKDNNDEEDKKEKDQYKDLLETIKILLGARVTDVKISRRLTSSPVCMFTGGAGPTFNMELLMKGANQISPQARKVLELNPEHKVFATLQKIFKKDKHSVDLKNYCEILFNQALLIEGYELEDPVDFSKRLSELMANSY